MTRYVFALGLACALAGCASNMARQALELDTVPPPASPVQAPSSAAPPPASAPQATQQSGQGNVAAQLDASGWKGFEYTTAVPVGQVVLLALMLLLSHRREVLRIRQNGKRPCST